jgi:penicillin-binding protein 1C
MWWWCRALVGGIGAGGCILALAVAFALRPLPDQLQPPGAPSGKRQIVDRKGEPLSYTFSRGWNYSDQRPLHAIPEGLQRAFVEAEDHRFYEHSGVDWIARCHAMWQNLRALRPVRGASTISEQVVRMLHPRPRTVWSRFVEGFESRALERRFSKGEILEFYLNQVPFGARRRGVVQAARYFWDRDIETLSDRERLALAVMVRAPDRLDLHKNPHGIDRGVSILADDMVRQGTLDENARAALSLEKHHQTRADLTVRADHFIRYVQDRGSTGDASTIRTTISADLQRRTQDILDTRVRALASKQVTDGAVLVVNNRTAEVIAWVNAGSDEDGEGSQIDAIVTPRQPGSTLKPFLYAAALAKGWSPATMITDAPLAEPVGAGLHTYRNYSRMYYGDISLREALGNSLNIPAIKAVHFVGKYEFLQFLRSVGFVSLDKGAEFYGEGLALGNGEVTLFELVQGYATLARRGVWRPLKVTLDKEVSGRESPRRIMTPEVSSLIGDILSDPQARRREFGSDGVLRLPVQTAVKTGTSTDYRDALIIGYTEEYTVGVWMGNLNRLSMHDITGAKGPALVLRSVFAELQRLSDPTPLYLSPSLLHRSVCPHSGKLAGSSCPQVEELFIGSTAPSGSCDGRHRLPGARENDAAHRGPSVTITMPTPGLHIARDPRIPDHAEAFPFEVVTTGEVSDVTWFVDGEEFARSEGGGTKALWPLVEGRHTVRAVVRFPETSEVATSQEVGFWVR